MEVNINAEWWEIVVLLILGGFGWGFGDGAGRWLYDALKRRRDR